MASILNHEQARARVAGQFVALEPGGSLLIMVLIILNRRTPMRAEFVMPQRS
jgi:hypothetical protein